MKRNPLPLALLALLIAAAVGCGTGQQQPSTAATVAPAPAPAPASDLVPLDPEIRTGVLDNGLTYFIRRHPEPQQRAELRLVVNAGSVLEDDDQRGLAHFVEHMCFNGTENFAKQELVEYLERIGLRFGPDLNAYTSFDETVYMLQIPTDDDEIVDTGFEILGEWAHRVSFDDDEIDKERGVVIEEWRLGRGAEARIFDRQAPILLKDSRYAERLVIGDKETIATAPHEALRRFYRDWYRPDLMAVVAVGDFDPDRIEELIRANFEVIPAAEDPRPRVSFPVPDHSETLYAIATDPEATITRVGVYRKLPKIELATVADYRERLVERLHDAMLNRRLDERTRAADPPYLFAFAGSGSFVRTKGAASLGAVVKDGGLDRGLEALVTEAERVRRHGFTASELERAKSASLRSLEQSFLERDKVKSGALAAELVRHFLEGEAAPGIGAELELARELYPGITLEEVNDLAGERLAADNRVITASAPEKPGLDPPTETAIAVVLAGVSSAEIDPYRDTVADQPLMAAMPPQAAIVESSTIPELEVTEWRLANGVRVLLRLTDFKNDEVVFTAFAPGGHSLAADDDYIAAITADSVVVEGGVGPFDLTTLSKLLADKIVSVRPYISELEQGVSGSASPRDLELMFQLIHLYMTAPRADEQAFASVVERYRGLIANRLARPEAVFSDEFTRLMSQDHPRRRPWTLATLDGMDLETSYRFYSDRFADASGFTFIFVGNLSLEVMRPLVRGYLGSLPSSGRGETWRDVGVRAPEGVVEATVERGIEPKSQVVIAFPADFSWTRDNRFALRSAAAALRIKLRELLREDQGGTYGVSVRASVERLPRAASTFTVSFGCDPERVDELKAMVYREIGSLRQAGPPADDVAKIQQQERRGYELDLRENGFWLGNLEAALWNDEDPRQILAYGELIEGLTPDIVQRAAERWVDLDRRVEVVLKPEAK